MGVGFVPIDGFTGFRMGGHADKLRRIAGKGFPVQGILPAFVGEGGVNVIQIHKIPLEQKVAEAGILFPESVGLVEAVVPPLLAGQIGGHVGAAGGNADAVVKVNSGVQTGVQHAAAVNVPETAANIDCSDFGHKIHLLSGDRLFF